MSESRLRAIVDTAVDGIVLVDARGLVTMFNPACERMFGYRADEVVGGDVERLLSPPPAAEQNRRLQIRRCSEVTGQRKDGQTFPLDLSMGEGKHEGEVFYVGVLRDATERNRADELRQRFIEQLTAANEEQGRFADVASHDLREPLRTVGAFSRLLMKDYGQQLDDRGREYLSLMVSATTQMQELLDDLVEFGRLGVESERMCWFDSSACFDQMLETLHESVRQSGAEVVRGALPRLYGSPARFARLMQNLIGNALKYVDAGVAPHVRVSAAREGEFWRFSIVDNGIGIEARHHEQIFEPFKRLHARSRYDGMGLGLAICRKIVDGFGGRIGVASNPGEGSIFSFTTKVGGGDGGA